jgi:hypothetical protein
MRWRMSFRATGSAGHVERAKSAEASTVDARTTGRTSAPTAIVMTADGGGHDTCARSVWSTMARRHEVHSGNQRVIGAIPSEVGVACQPTDGAAAGIASQ